MKISRAFSFALLLPVLATSPLTSSARAEGIEAKLELMPTGVMMKMGAHMPQRVTLSTNQPEGIKKLPAGLIAPLFGEIKFGPSEAPGSFFVVVDEPDGKAPRLFVDANANGDLTDDPAAEWLAKTNKMPAMAGSKSAPKELITFSGGANLKVRYEGETLELHIPMYRFDKNDPQRASLSSNLFYYADYARVGTLKLGDKTYDVMLTDPLATGDFRSIGNATAPKTVASMSRPVTLLIDVNGDGKFDGRHESFPINKPFNIGGTTYEIEGMKASGASFQLVKSTNTVPESVPPPSLTAGKPALPFTAKTTDGTEIAFPTAYKGKLVILDFWATWCGPCVAELPHLTNAYNEFHPKGVEVLGISLDQTNAAAKLAKFTEEHNMPWPQVYDGAWWKAEVATNYFIESIPHAFLVDGDTGKIIAEGNALRGEALVPTLEKALAKKAP